jgi:hypothetical protein
MNETADIEGRLNDYRRLLATHLQDLEGALRGTLSVRRRIVSHPGAAMIAALGAGILVGALSRRRFSRRHQHPDIRSPAPYSDRSVLWRFARDTLVTWALRFALSDRKRR